MSEAEMNFHDIASQIPDAKLGKVFGAQCIKSGRKVAAILWKSEVLFKMDTMEQKEALALNGAYPSKHLYGDKPLHGWITIPWQQSGKWLDFARKSINYVSALK